MTEALSATPWYVDFRQLDKGAKPAGFAVAGTENVTLLRIDLNNRVHQIAAPAPGMLHFALPAKSQAPVRFGRRLLENETMPLIDPGAGVNAVNQPGFSLYTLSVKTARIEEVMASIGAELGSADAGPTGSQRRLPPRVAASLRRSAAAVLTRAADSTSIADGALIESLETDLVLAFASSFSGGKALPYVSRSNRSRALKRALAYIHAHSSEFDSVETLCLESATSLSTLQRVFREHFGLSPKQYLNVIRLSAVRRALLRPGENRTISELASQWGFWHMSRFTVDYKRQFGECPSDTRRSP